MSIIKEFIIPERGLYTEVTIDTKRKNQRPIYLLFNGEINPDRQSYLKDTKVREVIYDNIAEIQENSPFLKFILAGRIASLASDLYDKDEYKSKALLLTADQIAMSFCSYGDEPYPIK
jgi:hypothetical protein